MAGILDALRGRQKDARQELRDMARAEAVGKQRQDAAKLERLLASCGLTAEDFAADVELFRQAENLKAIADQADSRAVSLSVCRRSLKEHKLETDHLLSVRRDEERGLQDKAAAAAQKLDESARAARDLALLQYAHPEMFPDGRPADLDGYSLHSPANSVCMVGEDLPARIVPEDVFRLENSRRLQIMNEARAHAQRHGRKAPTWQELVKAGKTKNWQPGDLLPPIHADAEVAGGVA